MSAATHRHDASNQVELPAEFLDELLPADPDDPTADDAPHDNDEVVALAPQPASAAALEGLDGALMLLRGLSARKRSKVFPAA